jgi:pilus assembly protein Flp/PilA
VTFRRLLRHDGGATAIEYGLIVACVTLAILGGMTFFAGNENAMYTHISTAIGGATR